MMRLAIHPPLLCARRRRGDLRHRAELSTASRACSCLGSLARTHFDRRSTQEADISTKGLAKVDWHVKATDAKDAKITGQTSTSEESDALEMTVPIRPQGLSVHQSKSGNIANSGADKYTFSFPPDAEPGSRSVSVRLSSSLAGSIFNALDFLVSFPYGCVEQTMSAFLPDLMVSKAMQDLGVKTSIDPATLARQVNSVSIACTGCSMKMADGVGGPTTRATHL